MVRGAGLGEAEEHLRSLPLHACLQFLEAET